ncbi:MAG TPA: (d)CMP kinase [Candidatus Cybelea sp.]|nr:(d)CMP kinase [Candidatus Cybelea sp.]
MIIAIDGPVAAGKGTLARRLAQHFGYAYLDSGSLYRAVARRVLRAGANPSNAATSTAAAKALQADDLNDPALRDQAVGDAASKVAAFPSVREALLEYQRSFAKQPPGGAAGAVLDGRDIGTVVCPGADAKLFVTARPDVRARRRFLEIQARGGPETFEQVLAELKARDARDTARKVAPLKPAPDAHLLDTSDLDIDTAFAAALAYIESRTRAK